MKTIHSQAAEDKVLYIMRGISGSGKSTLARQLGEGGAVFSTDDFFMVNGKYQFDRDFMSEAHFWNQTRAVEAMDKGISPIVIDNTNVEAWEPKFYVEEAMKRGYRVEIKESQTPWRFDANELARRNTHGVPLDVIQGMIDKWHPDMTVDDILNAEKPKLSSSRGKAVKGNWYQNLKLANRFNTFPRMQERDKESIVQMIKGLGSSRGVSEGTQESIINEVMSKLNMGHDAESVRNWARTAVQQAA